MKEINHYYSLSHEWLQDIVIGLETELLDNRVIVIPEKYGIGNIYFIEVMDGVSVIFLDFILNVPVKVNRLKSDNKLYVLQYDLSEEINLLKFDGAEHKIGYSINLGLAVLNNQTSNTFVPAIGKRIFALRILVDKKLLNDSIKHKYERENGERKIKKGDKTLFFFDHIDSKSKLVIHGLKTKSINDESFDYYIKSIAQKLLANFIDRYSCLIPEHNNIPEIEIEMMIKTKDYLLENLLNDFPSLNFLAEMAGVSVSKYKSLFKKLFIDTPKNFFIREKMYLAESLLKSGRFNTITEILYELNYSKLSYFTSKYFEVHNRRPSDDFVNKKDKESLILSSL